MLFNSVAFLVFLPIVFGLYWSFARHLRVQNTLLVISSYIFYGWWDYRFLALIIASSLTDYVVGLAIQRRSDRTGRRFLLAVSIAVNLGILGLFKYHDFFVSSFADLLSGFGLNPNVRLLQFILPVGISFYTFQTLSYTIDVYRKKIPATRDLIAFFAFVSFFPQLVAGPIERATNLLPQFTARRSFDVGQAKDGLRQMLWGMFKKVVIADNLAPYVDMVFADYASLDAVALSIGVFCFAIQIYCDFSGYSDIAIGLGRIFGIRLMRNFAFPYFARDIAEFWRRWHISLSTWFRDYVYISLGGNRVKTSRRAANVILTFTASGLWHGANWTFLAWGVLHGLYYLPLMLGGSHRSNTGGIAVGRLLPTVREVMAIGTTFALVCFAWIFFRSESINDAYGFVASFGRGPIVEGDYWHGQFLKPLVLSFAMLAIEWIQRGKQHALDVCELPLVGRWAAYLLTSLAILLLGNYGGLSFIYFQF